MSTLTVKVLEALDQAGAVSKEKAVAGVKLEVDHPLAREKQNMVNQCLAGTYAARRDVVGRVKITGEQRKVAGLQQSTRYFYYLKRSLDKIKFASDGSLKKKPYTMPDRRKRVNPISTVDTSTKEKCVCSVTGPGLSMERDVNEVQLKQIIAILMGD